MSSTAPVTKKSSSSSVVLRGKKRTSSAVHQILIDALSAVATLTTQSEEAEEEVVGGGDKEKEEEAEKNPKPLKRLRRSIADDDDTAEEAASTESEPPKQINQKDEKRTEAKKEKENENEKEMDYSDENGVYLIGEGPIYQYCLLHLSDDKDEDKSTQRLVQKGQVVELTYRTEWERAGELHTGCAIVRSFEQSASDGSVSVNIDWMYSYDDIHRSLSEIPEIDAEATLFTNMFHAGDYATSKHRDKQPVESIVRVITDHPRHVFHWDYVHKKLSSQPSVSTELSAYTGTRAFQNFNDFLLASPHNMWRTTFGRLVYDKFRTYLTFGVKSNMWIADILMGPTRQLPTGWDFSWKKLIEPYVDQCGICKMKKRLQYTCKIPSSSASASASASASSSPSVKSLQTFGKYSSVEKDKPKEEEWIAVGMHCKKKLVNLSYLMYLIRWVYTWYHKEIRHYSDVTSWFDKVKESLETLDYMATDANSDKQHPLVEYRGVDGQIYRQQSDISKEPEEEESPRQQKQQRRQRRQKRRDKLSTDPAAHSASSSSSSSSVPVQVPDSDTEEQAEDGVAEQTTTTDVGSPDIDAETY